MKTRHKLTKLEKSREKLQQISKKFRKSEGKTLKNFSFSKLKNLKEKKYIFRPSCTTKIKPRRGQQFKRSIKIRILKQ